jgi:hypothetical protein
MPKKILKNGAILIYRPNKFERAEIDLMMAGMGAGLTARVLTEKPRRLVVTDREISPCCRKSRRTLLRNLIPKSRKEWSL